MSDSDDGLNLPPRNVNTFCIPNEPALLDVRELYRTSPSTRQLESERNREVFADAFIDDERLGTLAALCVRAIAKWPIRCIPNAVLEDPVKLRIYFDSLSVELPLKDCYFIEDLRFWRRVVLAKSRDKSLGLKKIDEYDWRGEGISLKYVELVEAFPAAGWRERQMAELGYLVRDCMRTLHIRHLQSLSDRAFKYHIESEPELDVTSDEPESLDISSDESDTFVDEEMGQEEDSESGQEKDDSVEAPPEKPKEVKKKTFKIAKEQSSTGISRHLSIYDSAVSIVSAEEEAEPEDIGQERRRRSREARREAMQRLRELYAEQLEEHRRRQQTRNLLRQRPPEIKKKRRPKQSDKKKPVIQSVYDLQVEPEPIDENDKVVYNQQRLARLKTYNYPPKDCHHIDLSFVRYFDLLTSLTLEFLGPHDNRNYHQRHLNFSYTDITRLAKGVRTLSQLQIFRLRNSRMDNIKLIILARALRELDLLQFVDLGDNRLGDDSNIGLGILLKRRVMLRALELENNDLGYVALETLGYALRRFGPVDSDSALRYLGLSYNPVGNNGLMALVEDIIGTQHVQELRINGLHNVSPGTFVEQVSQLLRNHAPLRRLEMTANMLNERVGRDLLRSLEQNHKVLHFDCRACNLSEQEEFEADVIVRRNEYQEKNTFIGDTTQTEEKLLELLLSRRHPIKAKLEEEQARQAECLLFRQPENRDDSSSKSEQEEALKEDEPQEDYDIWKSFGIVPIGGSAEVIVQHYNSTISTPCSFQYNPNNFTLDEVREHMHLMGSANRFQQRF